jgi:hypothetical protein
MGVTISDQNMISDVSPPEHQTFTTTHFDNLLQQIGFVCFISKHNIMIITCTFITITNWTIRCGMGGFVSDPKQIDSPHNTEPPHVQTL